MRKHILLPILAVMLLAIPTVAQKQLKNYSFEDWNKMDVFAPKDYNSPVTDGFFVPGNVERVKDAHDGTYSVKLETKESNGDVMIGYIANFNVMNFSGGVKYTKDPKKISGYYKSDVKAGDTAFILVMFKKSGVQIAQIIERFPMAKNTNIWTSFEINFTLPVTPDTMLFAVASSNVIDDIGIANGSWIMLDHLQIEASDGVVDPLPNGSFENWTPHTFHTVKDWSTFNVYFPAYPDKPVDITDDASDGSSALKLNTIDVDDPFGGIVSNSSSILDMSGEEWTWSPTRVTFDFQNFRAANDSAVVFFDFRKNGNTIEFVSFSLKDNTNGYTTISDTIALQSTPDSMRVVIYNGEVPGSWFIIDNIVFDYPVGVTENVQLTQVIGYPNPAIDILNFRFNASNDADVTLSVYDLTGRLVLSKQVMVAPGETLESIDVSKLKPGSYIYTIEMEGEHFTRKFIKE